MIGAISQAAKLVTPEQTAKSLTCGPKADDDLAAFKPYADAGFDEVYVADIGPHYADMIAMYRDEVLPALAK